MLIRDYELSEVTCLSCLFMVNRQFVAEILNIHSWQTNVSRLNSFISLFLFAHYIPMIRWSISSPLKLLLTAIVSFRFFSSAPFSLIRESINSWNSWMRNDIFRIVQASEKYKMSISCRCRCCCLKARMMIRRKKNKWFHCNNFN